jgi:hypothetical protein
MTSSKLGLFRIVLSPVSWCAISAFDAALGDAIAAAANEELATIRAALQTWRVFHEMNESPAAGTATATVNHAAECSNVLHLLWHFEIPLCCFNRLNGATCAWRVSSVDWFA